MDTIKKVAFITVFIQYCIGFNLDVENADIIEGTQKHSEFGYSVALWKDVNNKHWIVIAAPSTKKRLVNDSSEFNSRSSHPRVVDPPLGASGTENSFSVGNIVLCDMNKECQGLKTLPLLNTEEERKSLTMALKQGLPSIGLGESISVTKSSNPLLICSPRYAKLMEHPKESLFLQGNCYVLKDKNSPPKLVSPYTQTYSNWGRRHSEASSANIGMGTYLSNDSFIALGAPSIYYSSGGVITYDMKDPHRAYNPSPRSPKRSHGDAFYEGWSTTGGKFDGIREYLAVSVPGRPTLLGKVIFYTRQLRRIPHFRLTGDQYGARFGDNLSTGDFDGDSVDDLAVSSHLSHVAIRGLNDKDHLIRDSGKVYIYYAPLLNVGKSQKTQILSSGGTEAFFGFSLLCPGDLNGDKYHDLVIGAPYDEWGKVYIYSGSQKGLLSKPTQIIKHSDFFQVGFRFQKGIGFSLGGGIDLDNNGFPDVVIGARNSNSAIILRTAPVIKLKIESTLSHAGTINLGKYKCMITLPDKSKAYLTCFNMTLHVQYISQEFDAKIVVSIAINLDAKNTDSRILFNTNRRLFYLERGINNAKHTPEPFNILVYVKPAKPSLTEPIYTNIKVNLLSRIRMSKTLNIDENPSNRFDSPVILPILDMFSTNELETSVRLLCENPDTCFTKPDLILNIEGNKTFQIGQKDYYRLNFMVTVELDPAFQIRLTGTIPNEFVYVRAIADTNSLKNYLDIWCLIQDTKDNISIPISDMYCQISDYLPAGSKVKFTLIFDHLPMKMVEKRRADIEEFFFYFKVFGDTDDKNDDDNVIVWSTKTLFENNMLIISSSTPEYLSILVNDTNIWSSERTSTVEHGVKFISKNEIEVLSSSSLKILGPRVLHKYTLVNIGPSPLLDAKLSIFWPSHLDQLELSVIENISTQGKIKCEFSKRLQFKVKVDVKKELIGSQNNTYGYRKEKNNEKSNDNKRLKLHNIWIEESNKRKPKILKLSCSSVSCINIKCDVGTLLTRDEVSINVKAIVIATNFKAMKYRHYEVKSEISVDSDFLKFSNESSVTSFLTVGNKQLTLTEIIEYNWWILLISIIIGLLIIFLLSGLLYKIGFFNRKRIQNSVLVNPSYPNEAVILSSRKSSLMHRSNSTKITEVKDYLPQSDNFAYEKT